MNKQILLIDDDFDEQEIFKEAVTASQQTINCFFATDAKQGFSLLENVKPDFIFLDINLPGMNGFQCLNEIKKQDGLKNIPVIMYSTGIDKDTTTSAIAQGASGCIKKQGSINDLAVILNKILSYSSNSIY